MKRKCLISNVTAVDSLARAESEIFWVILDVFWGIQGAIVVGQPLSDLEMSS
jgi:hypothetical protein